MALGQNLESALKVGLTTKKNKQSVSINASLLKENAKQLATKLGQEFDFSIATSLTSFFFTVERGAASSSQSSYEISRVNS